MLQSDDVAAIRPQGPRVASLALGSRARQSRAGSNWACAMASMHLYSLTLQKSSAITAAVHGNFSAPRQQELILVRGGKVLELARPDENGKVQTVCSTELFGIVRSLATRRAGAVTQ